MLRFMRLGPFRRFEACSSRCEGREVVLADGVAGGDESGRAAWCAVWSRSAHNGYDDCDLSFDLRAIGTVPGRGEDVADEPGLGILIGDPVGVGAVGRGAGSE